MVKNKPLKKKIDENFRFDESKLNDSVESVSFFTGPKKAKTTRKKAKKYMQVNPKEKIEQGKFFCNAP